MKTIISSKISELKSISELPENEKLEDMLFNGAGRTQNYKVSLNNIIEPIMNFAKENLVTKDDINNSLEAANNDIEEINNIIGIQNETK